MFLLSLLFAAGEFPICVAPGDQLYPDVCWDGEAFWVVWQDDELGTIRGRRINENGYPVGEEVELLEKSDRPEPLRFPNVAASPERIAVEARSMAGYDDFGNSCWGVIHREFSLDGQPITSDPIRIYDSYIRVGGITTPIVLYGKNHFYSFYNMSYQNELDAHMWSLGVGLDSGGTKQGYIWSSSDVHCEWQPPVVCWDGQHFFLISIALQRATFLTDILLFQGLGGELEINRMGYFNETLLKSQALTSGASRYLFIGEVSHYQKYSNQIGFDILDSAGMLLHDSSTVLDFRPDAYSCYPDAIFNGGNFVCVWENRRSGGGIDLYSVKVDTSGNLVDAGYVVYGKDTAQHPALACGRNKYILVWADNRNGSFNIYGKLQNTEGVGEVPPSSDLVNLSVNRTVFKDEVCIYLFSVASIDNTILVHDVTGRVVRKIDIRAGCTRCMWDGRDALGSPVVPGVYFITIEKSSTAAPVRVIRLW